MRTLIVEDDYTSRLVLETFLSRFGECNIAVNGMAAVNAFLAALDNGKRYDLVCMDIMMPEMDGVETVRRIRAMEQSRGILSTAGVKIIMTTALTDIREVARSFDELCDAYLVKPINLEELRKQAVSYQLIQ